MVGLIILLVLLLSSVYLLFAPFFIEINTVAGLYRVRFHRLANARLISDERSLIVKLNIAGWHKTIDLLAQRKQNGMPQRKKKVKAKSKLPRISFRKMKAIFKSFKINKFRIDMDTGNMPLNGVLYTCFTWLRVYSGKDISINFIDDNEMILEIENNCARVIWAYLKS